MVSSCLQGQTGPHKDYPGFGGQGSALGGYNLLTGWPDREPVGPFGTITDSLAPRFVAERPGRRPSLPAADGRRRPPRREPGGGGRLLAVAVDRRLRRATATPASARATGRTASSPTAPSAARATTGGWPSPAGTTTTGAAWPAVMGIDDATTSRLGHLRGPTARPSTRSRSWWRPGRRAATAAAVAETLQAAGVEAVPVADLGDAFGRSPAGPPGPLRHARASLHGRRAATSATASGCPTPPPATSGRARCWASTTRWCWARSSA